MEATHITSNPRSGKLGTINEDDDDELYKIKHKNLIRMIRVLYDGFKCSVSSFFAIEWSVKQGCLLSGLLFIIIIDWLLKRTTEGRDTGIKWVRDEILEMSTMQTILL